MRSLHITVAAAFLAAAPVPSAAAQGSLASRVAQARDGVVRLQYEARAGVCGDGHDMVGYKQAMFARSFESYGRWSNAHCAPGPLRVTASVSGGRVTRVETQVGGAWPRAEGTVTDLGTVAAHDASAFFFSLIPTLEATQSNRDRLLLPAVLADGAPVIAPLLTLARDTERTERTRRQAVQWLGLVGDASVIPPLTQFARQGSGGDSDGKGISSAAVAALSSLEDNAGIPALLDLSRDGSSSLRYTTAFWLGQNADPRALRRLHQMIEDRNEEERVRAQAVFGLAHGDQVSSAEFQYLRDVYARLEGDKLKEAVLFAMTEDDVAGGRWLIQRARDQSEPYKTRKSALFWAGQREATPTSELLGVFRDADDSALREHAIFVLSQRQDEQATDALIRIARGDGDTKMRGKALFWLAQRKDPRVTKLITDLITR